MYYKMRDNQFENEGVYQRTWRENTLRDGGSKEKRKHGVITIILKCIKIKIFKKLKHPTFRCLSAIQKYKI